MLRRDYRDILAGVFLIAIGSGATAYAWAYYPLGTITHMAAGMFPAGLGVLLAVIGALILLPALFRPGPELSSPDIRSFVFVALALAVFAGTVRSLGLVPATMLVTIIAVLADNKLGVLGTVALAVVLSAAAWLIFNVALGIPLEPFRWPFR